MDVDIGDDSCPVPKPKDHFSERNLITAATDSIGVIASGKKMVGIS